jgi:fatty acid desaturase
METDSLPTAENKPPKPRWYQPTPGRLLVVLLAVEGVLLLSERFQWFPFNQQKGWIVLIAIASVVAAMALMLLWFFLALLFHWRFQFSLRSLLVLTVAVAIPFSWLAVEMKAARQQREAVKALLQLGGVEGLVRLGGTVGYA